MADISKYLEDILSAIYGEEVRRSIHDAIAAIDNEVYTGVEDAKAEVAKAAVEAANAAASAQSAASEADRATVAADNAGSSAGQAYMSATEAGNQASNAASSASSASSSASKAAASATLSQSWATGDTASRAGEESNNSKYYAEQAQRALSAISGSLVPMGTITFEQLPSEPLQPGVMYNISNEFTTDNRFNEGSGHKYGAGTNVYWTGESKWDCLASPGGTGTTISPYVNTPRPPSTTGSPGSAEEYARGDHVHPIQTHLPFYSSYMTEEQLNNKETFSARSMAISWLPGDIPGTPTPGDGGTLLNIRGASLINSMQLFFGDSGVQGVYVRRSKSDAEFMNWIKLAEINDITADNFTGILPVEKGGTGNSIFEPIYEELSTTDFRTQINQPAESAFIMPASHGVVGSDNWEIFAPGVKFGVGNTHGYIMVSHTVPSVKIGGGYNSVTQWSKSVAFIDSNIADFSGVLPIEKGGTGSSTGLSNAMLKSSGGIIDEDWNNLFTKKQNAIYTIATWSFEKPNAVPVNAFFGTLFNYYDEGMDYGYQLAVNVGGYLYLREWHDGTIFGEWRQIITSKDVATTAAAGLVKPGAGLQVSEDGTLSVTGSSGDYHIHIIYGVKWTSNYQILICTGVDTITGDVAEFPITALATVTSKYIANGVPSGTDTLYGLLNISISYSFGFTVNFQIQTTDLNHSSSTAAEVFNLFKRIYPENFQVPATGYWLQSN